MGTFDTEYSKNIPKNQQKGQIKNVAKIKN